MKVLIIVLIFLNTILLVADSEAAEDVSIEFFKKDFVSIKLDEVQLEEMHFYITYGLTSKKASELKSYEKRYIGKPIDILVDGKLVEEEKLYSYEIENSRGIWDFPEEQARWVEGKILAKDSDDTPLVTYRFNDRYLREASDEIAFTKAGVSEAEIVSDNGREMLSYKLSDEAAKRFLRFTMFHLRKATDFYVGDSLVSKDMVISEPISGGAGIISHPDSNSANWFVDKVKGNGPADEVLMRVVVSDR